MLAVFLLAIVTSQCLVAKNISGKVLYQNDSFRPLSNVTVQLKNVGNNTTQTYVTNASGHYHFNNVPEGNYILTGTTSLNAGGVTYYDPTQLFQYLNGLITLTPLQMLAADVDGNSLVSWADYDLILTNILNSNPFPDGPWQFESLVFSITDMKDGVPHGLGGTCSGDIGGTFVPTANNTPALPLTCEGVINVAKGEPFTTRIYTHNQLSVTGVGVIINYPSELVEITSVEFKGSEYDYSVANGQIRLVWGNPNTAPVHFTEGEAFITIRGVSTSAFKQGMTANLSLDGNTCLINPANEDISALNFASPVLKYGNPALKLSNYPNPFTATTNLRIYSAEDGYSTIEVYNTRGQLVKNIVAGSITAGYHEIDLDASQMASGNYTCKLRLTNSAGELTKTIQILKAE